MFDDQAAFQQPLSFGDALDPAQTDLRDYDIASSIEQHAPMSTEPKFEPQSRIPLCISPVRVKTALGSVGRNFCQRAAPDVHRADLSHDPWQLQAMG